MKYIVGKFIGTRNSYKLVPWELLNKKTELSAMHSKIVEYSLIRELSELIIIREKKRQNYLQCIQKLLNIV